LRQGSLLAFAGIAAVVGAGALVAAFVLARGGSGAHRVVVSDTGCGFHWTPPRSGRTIFSISSASADTTFSVAIVGADQRSIYGQIDELAPGTELPLDVVLPPGGYAFRCETSSGYTLVSPTEQVRGGPVAGAHPYTPVDKQQMELAMLDYRASLLPILRRLASDTDRLTAAVADERLAAARSLWLPAHLDYAQLGVAYDTFGQFNDEIDGRPLGLPGGVHDPDFTGFLRLEYGLWHRQPAGELRPVAAALDRAVHGLLEQFPKMQIPTGDLSLRAHEILENTLQFELTGETDEGSHTNLATAWANAKGTGLALRALSTVLEQASPRLLADATTGVDEFTAELKSYRHPDGNWVPLQSLTTGQRERLDGTLSGLLEHLELVPDVLQPAPTGGGDG
jgi:high-affinity iron transporter